MLASVLCTFRSAVGSHKTRNSLIYRAGKKCGNASGSLVFTHTQKKRIGSFAGQEPRIALFVNVDREMCHSFRGRIIKAAGCELNPRKSVINVGDAPGWYTSSKDRNKSSNSFSRQHHQRGMHVPSVLTFWTALITPYKEKNNCLKMSRIYYLLYIYVWPLQTRRPSIVPLIRNYTSAVMEARL